MAEEVKAEPKKDEDWMQKKWRPAMGWMYMVVCFCDMVLFPVAWSILQAVMHQPVTQWNPLTLQGAGLFHLAMGAVLGIAAWGRTQEKVAGAVPSEKFPSSPRTVKTAKGDVEVPPELLPRCGQKGAPTIQQLTREQLMEIINWVRNNS